MQINLTCTCRFSDNYAQVAAIKQVNVNLTQASIENGKAKLTNTPAFLRGDKTGRGNEQKPRRFKVRAAKTFLLWSFL